MDTTPQPNPHNTGKIVKAEIAEAVGTVRVKKVQQPKPGKLDRKITEFFEKADIFKVIYIDDEINCSKNNLEIVQTRIQTLEEILELETLNALLEINLPPDNLTISNAIGNVWDELPENKKESIFDWAFKDSEQEPDDNRVLQLDKIFQFQNFIKYSPIEYSVEKPTLFDDVPQGKRVFFLFDHILSKCGGLYSVTTGLDLIKSIIDDKALKNKTYCSLLTNKILEPEDELNKRQEFAATKAIDANKFFALAKKRINEDVFFIDGIKKTVLNTQLDLLKRKSLEVINHSYKKVKITVSDIDTYAFDQAVLKSSLTEGVWEGETFFRISKFLFDFYIHEKVGSKKPFLKSFNKIVEKSNILSKFDFESDNKKPNSLKFQLRQQELYYPSSIINKMYLPISNGDIFEITNYAGEKNLYILVCQPCDIMLRKNGKRKAENGTFLKITNKTLEELNNLIEANSSEVKSGKPHFYATRFKLDFLFGDVEKVSYAEFAEGSLSINLDILDLSSSNEEGHCVFKANQNFNSNVFSNSVKNRYIKHLQPKLLLNYKKSKIATQNKASLINTFGNEIADIMCNSLLPTIFLSPGNNFLNLNSVLDTQSSSFKFGIQRLYRVKQPLSDYLLQRYNNHVARVAELHDFSKH